MRRNQGRAANRGTADGTLLGALPRRTQPPRGTDESGTRQIRVTIPASLAWSAAAWAAHLRVPVNAVYFAAIAGTLASRASAPYLAVTIPATCRRTTADLDVVGCYIGAVPVLAQAPTPGETQRDATMAARDWLQFAAEHAHADSGTGGRLLGARLRYWWPSKAHAADEQPGRSHGRRSNRQTAPPSKTCRSSSRPASVASLERRACSGVRVPWTRRLPLDSPQKSYPASAGSLTTRESAHRSLHTKGEGLPSEGTSDLELCLIAG